MTEAETDESLAKPKRLDIEDLPRPSLPSQPSRYNRRLTDKIFLAFHHACDQDDLQVATQLVSILEMLTARIPLNENANRRRDLGNLVAAYERIRDLQTICKSDILMVP